MNTLKEFFLLVLFIIPIGFSAAAQSNDEITAIQTMYENGNASAAIQQLNRLIEKNPKNEKALYERGKIFSEQRKLIDAIKDFNRVLELNPINQKAYYLRGYTKYLMGSFKAAIDDFNLALELHPTATLALWYMAESKIKTGDKAGACEAYDKAYTLGYSNAAKRIKEYCNDIQISAEAAADVFIKKGDEKMNTGNFSGALLEYEKAREIAPSSPMVLYNVGLAKFLLKDKIGACSLWEKAASNGNAEARNMHNQHCQ